MSETNKETYMKNVRALKEMYYFSEVTVTETDNGYVLSGPDKLYLGVHEHNDIVSLLVALPDDITKNVIEANDETNCTVDVKMLYTTNQGGVSSFPLTARPTTVESLSELETVPDNYFGEYSIFKALKSTRFLASLPATMAPEGEIAFEISVIDSSGVIQLRYCTNSIPYHMDSVKVQLAK